MTPAAAGSREGWPSGYMALRCKAIESSMRNSLSSRDSVARPDDAGGSGMVQRYAFARCAESPHGKTPRNHGFRSVFPIRLDVETSSRLIHSPHAAAAGHRRSLFLLFLLHHDALGREEQARDGRGVLQRGAGDLGRVDDAGRDQILELPRLGVEAEVLVLRLLDLAHDDGALGARILHDHPDGLLDRATHDRDADLLVLIRALHLVERALAPQQSHAAARHDA